MLQVLCLGAPTRPVEASRTAAVLETVEGDQPKSACSTDSAQTFIPLPTN